MQYHTKNIRSCRSLKVESALGHSHSPPFLEFNISNVCDKTVAETELCAPVIHEHEKRRFGHW